MSSNPDVIEQKALTLAQQAQLITIADQKTYDKAAFMLRDVIVMRNEIAEYHAPLKAAAWMAHKAIVEAEKKMLYPVERAESILKAAISTFTKEQERIQAELQREADLLASQEAARKRQEEADAAAAVAAAAISTQVEDALASPDLTFEETEEILARASGVVEEARHEVMTQPVVVERPYVEPVLYKARGISTPKRYVAEVRSMKELCAAIGRGEISDSLVLPNFPALNKMASALKEGFRVPGCEVKTETDVRARGR